MAEVLLEARDLKQYYPVKQGFLQRTVGYVKANDGVSFTIERGKTLSLVGESGAGKTTTAKAILMLETLTSGSILFEGRDIFKLSRSQIKKEYRPKVQAVQQNPWSSMNPRMRVRDIVAEPLVENTKLPGNRCVTKWLKYWTRLDSDLKMSTAIPMSSAADRDNALP